MTNTDLCIPVSIGELCDKFTILQIKKENISNESMLNKIEFEIQSLSSLIEELNIPDDYLFKLKSINTKLWNIEDLIRNKERLKTFDNEFIELARSVYITNDIRFEIKNEINTFFQSEIVEVKSYNKY